MIKKITTSSFIFFLTLLFTINIFSKDILTSFSERRELKTFPDFTVEKLFNGKFMTEFESYSLDQFVFREFFRQVRATFDLNVLNKNDVNDIFLYKNHLIKLDYPYSEKNVLNFKQYIQKITDQYLSDANIFLAIIPDKAYYVNDSIYPTINYDALAKSVSNVLQNITYINLFDQLSLDDYYKTDTHWKQENLLPLANFIGSYMNFDTDFNTIDYDVKSFDEFYGVYHGQSSLNQPPDILSYLVSEAMKDVTIINYQYPKDNDLAIYDTIKLGSMDSYDTFLSGASPLIEIINNKATREKELIIFRDSFASSFTPLLLDEYSKITLVDTRYVSYQVLDQFIDFKDQDVLFMYSTIVINNSQMLK